MDALAAEGIFLFEGFRFDRRAGGLFRVDDNCVAVPVRLGARALDVLGVLLARPGEIVSKDEIIATVWPGRIVEDSNLPTQISALRRALDAGRSQPSCIQTVSGRGYRFVRPATQHAAETHAGTPLGSLEVLRTFSSYGAKPSGPLANVRSPELQPSSVLSAERRQLTLMICDLAGAETLASRLDPEELREIIAAYHRTVTEVVVSFEGFVGGHMGDTVLVYFGYPRAHEDDAERAVRAGLGVIDAVGCLDLKSYKLQTRVGIATGLVVISEGSAEGRLAIGETPYLAARLKVLAEPDMVVIAAGTHRLTGGLFEYRDLGTVQVVGIAAPVRAWQVLRPSSVASRFEALRGSSALTPLVGRDEELDLLLRRWARAQTGDGQVVLISGEPGIGKSRATAELEGRLHPEPHICLRYFCSPYHQDSALFPFVDQLGRAAGFASDDPPGARRVKLETLLTRAARCGIRRRSAVAASVGPPPAAKP
jgi:class 3 adenylate cyclase/DNA-binding winged helix-turn-helix (wHTH) protein